MLCCVRSTDYELRPCAAAAAFKLVQSMFADYLTGVVEIAIRTRVWHRFHMTVSSSMRSIEPLRAAVVARESTLSFARTGR